MVGGPIVGALTARHPLRRSNLALLVIGALIVSWALVLAWRRPRFTAQAGLALPGLNRMVDAPVTRALARLLALALWLWRGPAMLSF